MNSSGSTVVFVSISTKSIAARSAQYNPVRFAQEHIPTVGKSAIMTRRNEFATLHKDKDEPCGLRQEAGRARTQGRHPPGQN